MSLPGIHEATQIVINFGKGVTREYVLVETTDKSLISGGVCTLKFRHPNFAEHCEADIEMPKTANVNCAKEDKEETDDEKLERYKVCLEVIAFSFHEDNPERHLEKYTPSQLALHALRIEPLKP